MAFAPSRIVGRGKPSEILSRYTSWRTQAQKDGIKAYHFKGEASLEADVDKRAFQHWKNNQTDRWNPPRYSQRRQAQLVSSAFQTGNLDAVKASPKYARFLERLDGQATHEVFNPLPTQSLPQLPRLSPQEDQKEAMRIAKQAHDRGPYAGRSTKKMFKGSKADRQAPIRHQRIQENMSRMDSIVEEWRRDKLTAKNKTKPVSPL
ncbi:hypothetical protein MYAM1_002103 [Malassezia yamatoensis]|uniref:Large ribosomal subunit protein mL59 domain-containing protein n=1 Tax=Malassezia yamatoensis TaxID=253288 RepID=A0AAJ6CGZ8_9BASI|nr:hypothetical protein MYAM1_002103 [Malassezia yamatoensis]